MPALDSKPLLCALCGLQTDSPNPLDLGSVRGNTTRFKDHRFSLWKCPECQSIHSLDPVDFADIYKEYPPNRRRLDVFAKATLGNLLGRLQKEGLLQDHLILDIGCGNGLFVDFLKERGYRNAVGYDPYVDEFSKLPTGPFDCVVANDVIEHLDNPRALLTQCIALLKPGGLLYIGTADSEPVAMNDLEPHLLRLHQPFHRVIFTNAGLRRLAAETGLELVGSYRRSYMDTRRPFSNYRFLDEFNRALGHEMDKAFEKGAGKLVGKKPALLFWAFFGYWFPCAFEPAVVLRMKMNLILPTLP